MAAGSRPSLAASESAGEPRGNGFRAVGVAVAKLAAPIIGKRGGRYLGRLKLAWPEIAGSDWAAVAWPSQLGRDGTLGLRVLPSAALELQHRAPLFIERVNLFLGGPVVTRLVLKQGMPPVPSAAASPPPPRKLTAGEAASLGLALAPVADPELRAALAGLARAILAATPTDAGVAPASETD